MSKKNQDMWGLNLQKISQSSSPEAINKKNQSPLRSSRARLQMSGFSETYKSFFKLESQVEVKNPKNMIKKVPTAQNLAQKDKVIQQLQQKIMKETVKKNARQKSYSSRIKTDWKNQIETLIMKFIKITIKIAEDNKNVQKSALKLIYKCNHQQNGSEKLKIIMGWIACWLQPIFQMISWVCQKKI